MFRSKFGIEFIIITSHISYWRTVLTAHLDFMRIGTTEYHVLLGAESTTIGALAVPPVLLLVMLVLFVDEMVFFIRDGLPMKRIRYCAWILGAFPVGKHLFVFLLFRRGVGSPVATGGIWWA